MHTAYLPRELLFLFRLQIARCLFDSTLLFLRMLADECDEIWPEIARPSTHFLDSLPLQLNQGGETVRLNICSVILDNAVSKNGCP